jgi:hypothetical protein
MPISEKRARGSVVTKQIRCILLMVASFQYITLNEYLSAAKSFRARMSSISTPPREGVLLGSVSFARGLTSPVLSWTRVSEKPIARSSQTTVCVFHHGIGEHGQRYATFAQELLARVPALDLFVT